ncbi:tagaturonate reductase [Paenibacillus sp. CAA11]|uniref:tagaturonate reductase n=1 Tax=Paenibacillus sp. CAA11 TaxID=1532905 RepID=UPI000D392591|nr:tagaturonate reductase [Paenibacillus sp. CAA11]AWB45505.1 tagaturonate reductase [Paenibacillus sp. CAA11]
MTKRLTRQFMNDLPVYPERVIQFGEGNFMRAFVDWQLQQMNNQGLFQGSAVLVQPIGQGLQDLLAEQDYLYTVLLNGIMDGEPVNSKEIMTSVSRMINPYSNYEAFMALAQDDNLEFITSNTTEAGITYRPEDRIEDTPPASFPAKLTILLHKRYELGKPGFVIIPCELIDRNGEKLREIIGKYAEDWKLGQEFMDWLDRENTFCCSLVDRIVPGYPRDKASELAEELGYEDKLMVTAEPFLFWVIEGPAEISERLPLAQAGLNVVVTDDMTPYRERKVHLLNGPHTAMVPLAMMAGLKTVEDVMNDEVFSQFVQELIEEELIPMLDLPRSELQSYASAVLERFRNPFIRHELASISLNSISKFKTRLLPILQRYQSENGKLPARIVLSFASLLLSYRGDQVQRQDNPEVIALFDKAWSEPARFVGSILQEASLWGEDLNQIPDLADQITRSIQQLEDQGSRSVVSQLTSLRGEE